MARRETAAEMLATAKSDLKALQNMSDADAFDDIVFCSHAQQIVEKTLNAWLNFLDQPHPYTHGLSLLHKLRKHGVRFRYGVSPEVSPDEGEEPLEQNEVFNAVRGLIEQVERLAQNVG